MFWLILVVIVLVVGAAALVALGGGGSLPDAERDRLAPHLPDDRALNRADVDELRFPMALRGYRMDDVDDALDRLAAELEHRDIRVAELEAALTAALAAGYPQAGEPGTAEFEALRLRFVAPGAQSGPEQERPAQDAIPGVDTPGVDTPGVDTAGVDAESTP